LLFIIHYTKLFLIQFFKENYTKIVKEVVNSKQ
jgi:hypothetical protein